MNKLSSINVFLTGATGHMGFEAFKLFLSDPLIKLKILCIGNKHDERILKPYKNHPRLEIIKGDLRNIQDVRKGVNGAHYVLHAGALIPPAAYRNPEVTEKINLGGTLNIIQAIREQENPNSVRLVYIASVASMGNRPVPIHWGRVGNPIKVGFFDAYAASKVKAERAVIESGLRCWVSLRQSGMLHGDLAKIMDPIIFHQPLDNRVEWSTAKDSGRALYHLCIKKLNDSFWRNSYNLSSGPEFRISYYDFLKTIFNKMGISDIHKIFKPNDFALQNFHCLWYEDADVLNKWLDFRKSKYEEFWKSLRIPAYYKLAKILPSFLMRKLIFYSLSGKDESPLYWIKKNQTDRINAFWGSRENWEKISDNWDDYLSEKNRSVKKIKHGFDEKKALSEISLEDCQEAASFRGGRCLSSHMRPGNIYTPLKWKCACNLEFSASPYLVLRTGHWCPECDLDVENYPSRAQNSLFFNQVYEPAIK